MLNMNSIITSNSFTNCKNLKKIYINPDSVINSLDLSKTKIRNHSTSEQYSKALSNDWTIYAPSRVIYQTKFPPKDASVGTDLTAEEITNLEKKLEKALGELFSKSISFTELLGKITGYRQSISEREQALKEAKEKEKKLLASLESLTTELNSSNVDKIALERQIQGLKEQVDMVSSLVNW